MRYIGWIKQNLAKDGQSVEGLIIAHTMEETARYAILGPAQRQDDDV